LPMYIALTGTPGTGKTSAAAILAKRGFTTMTVEELAEKHDALETVNGDKEVDTERLAKAMVVSPEKIIIVGHLAHHLPNQICIILRCHPEMMRKRLSKRNYSKEKLLENLEAEAIDIIMTEAIEACENVCEIDTSNLKPDEVANIIEKIMNGDADEYLPGKIDWSGAVMDWY
jgi:adenylate kinase